LWDLQSHIRGTIVSFEEIEVPVSEMRERIASVTLLPWLVAEQNGAIVGYAYAGLSPKRSAYRHSVETTIYVEEAQGRGYGTELYFALLEHCVPCRFERALGVG
jgi:phosphinothricin acetyltransferase